MTLAFLKGVAFELSDSFWRGGRRHHGGSGVCHHNLVGLDLGGENREKLDLPTLLIQRDLSQNFFCEISNFWLSRLGNQSNVAKGKMQHHGAVCKCDGVAFAGNGKSQPSILWLEICQSIQSVGKALAAPRCSLPWSCVR